MNPEPAPSTPPNWLRPYGTLLILLTLVAAALMSGGGDLEDVLIWVLAGALILAGTLMISGHQKARTVFLLAACVGILGCAYTLVVWGLSYLFDRSAVLATDMIEVLITALVCALYLAIGLFLFARAGRSRAGDQ